MGVESLRGRTGTRQWVWNKVGGAIKDVAGVAAVAAPGAYGRVRWSWEPELFGGKNAVGLTIDDAPGDNPELFEQVWNGVVRMPRSLRLRLCLRCNRNHTLKHKRTRLCLRLRIHLHAL